jgi:SAM-dependent methyltransferase
MAFSFFRKQKRGASDDLGDTLEKSRHAAFFVPTPWAVARQMLELAEVRPEDVLYDLGSGDGRIPILAAQEFGSRAIGLDIDEKLCRYAEEKVVEYHLQKQVSFKREDFFKANLSDATVVTLYLLPEVNGHLGPRLASQLRPGARVVALDYEVPAWRAAETRVVKSEGNIEYTLYLYRR